MASQFQLRNARRKSFNKHIIRQNRFVLFVFFIPIHTSLVIDYVPHIKHIQHIQVKTTYTFFLYITRIEVNLIDFAISHYTSNMRRIRGNFIIDLVPKLIFDEKN